MTGLKLFDLTGRVAVITGGSKGLGLSMAAGLASAGADIVIVSRHQAEADVVADQLVTQFGHRAIGVQADVGVETDTTALAERVMNEFGRVDILINNAGINLRGSINALTLDQFRQVQQVNVEGVWLACKSLVPHMKMGKSGRIINLSSALGVVGMPDRTPYCTSPQTSVLRGTLKMAA